MKYLSSKPFSVFMASKEVRKCPQCHGESSIYINGICQRCDRLNKIEELDPYIEVQGDRRKHERGNEVIGGGLSG